MPGIDDTSLFWFSPSTINSGKIRLAALKCVSCTIWRITSLLRFLLGRCSIISKLRLQITLWAGGAQSYINPNNYISYKSFTANLWRWDDFIRAFAFKKYYLALK